MTRSASGSDDEDGEAASALAAPSAAATCDATRSMDAPDASADVHASVRVAYACASSPASCVRRYRGEGGRVVSLLEASMMGCCFFSDASIGGCDPWEGEARTYRLHERPREPCTRRRGVHRGSRSHAQHHVRAVLQDTRGGVAITRAVLLPGVRGEIGRELARGVGIVGGRRRVGARGRG